MGDPGAPVMRGSWKPLTVIGPGRCVHRKDQKRLQLGASSLLYPSLLPSLMTVSDPTAVVFTTKIVG